eukprot:augustus_masked-scaffold_18-processed-gene-2.2-mRNA-1 protein AED:1.00 eAED:1.00 QI:0/-1/0/0/-1/1/1/0/310
MADYSKNVHLSRSYTMFTQYPAVQTVLQPVQDTLLLADSYNPYSFYSTIISATILLRVGMIPVSKYSRKQFQNLFSPESHKYSAYLHFMYSVETRKLAARINPKLSLQERKEALRKYLVLTKDLINGQRLIWKDFGAKPSKAVVGPVLQLSIFVTYALSIRDLVYQNKLDLTTEGALWFLDLMNKDEYFVLPLAATASSYYLIEIAFKAKGNKTEKGEQPRQIRLVDKPPKGKKIRKRPKLTAPSTPPPENQGSGKSFGPLVGNGLQYMLLFLFPLTASLPSAVFMYWLPSSFFGIAQMKIGSARGRTRR